MKCAPEHFWKGYLMTPRGRGSTGPPRSAPEIVHSAQPRKIPFLSHGFVELGWILIHIYSPLVRMRILYAVVLWAEVSGMFWYVLLSRKNRPSGRVSRIFVVRNLPLATPRFTYTYHTTDRIGPVARILKHGGQRDSVGGPFPQFPACGVTRFRGGECRLDSKCVWKSWSKKRMGKMFGNIDHYVK